MLVGIHMLGKSIKYIPIPPVSRQNGAALIKWTHRDLNPGPPPCQGDDLPSELPAHNNKN